LKEEGYNLDITYITERVIAMSYPATGFEVMYRNKLSDVSKYLDTKHEDHYRVYNLSNRPYNDSKFHG